MATLSDVLQQCSNIKLYTFATTQAKEYTTRTHISDPFDADACVCFNAWVMLKTNLYEQMYYKRSNDERLAWINKKNTQLLYLPLHTRTKIRCVRWSGKHLLIVYNLNELLQWTHFIPAVYRRMVALYKNAILNR